MTRIDILIVGGGLAGGLCAAALKRACPGIRLLLLEQGASFGGKHRWSWFDSDLSPAGHDLLADLRKNHWPDYEVRFPGRQRIIATRYNSIASHDFDIWLRARLDEREYRLSCQAITLDPGGIILGTGERIEAGLVLDARGPAQKDGLELGWQKFAGFEFALPGHGVTRPIVMDACVEQSAGYRFVYVLPIDEVRLFVEDTYYSLDPRLDVASLRENAMRYARRFGQGAEELHHESGVLPIVIAGDPKVFWPDNAPLARIGMAGGFFHHTTGYSLPDAVANAVDFARAFAARRANGADWWRTRFIENWQRQAYFRLLNRMLFHAAAPEQRYRIFEHFYRLPKGLIERFYTGRPRAGDKLRILSGKPPVGLGSAIAALAGRKGR